MSHSKFVINVAKSEGLQLNYSHLVVRASALALARISQLHKSLSASRNSESGQVDIAFSVIHHASAAPCLIVKGADRKNVVQIGEEISQAAVEMREDEGNLQLPLRRLSRPSSIACVTRSMFGAPFLRFGSRQKQSCVLAVNMLPGVDRVSSSFISSRAALFAGRVADRVTAFEGRPEIRPMTTLTCCADHRVWDWESGQMFLTSVSRILESEILLDELIRTKRLADRAVASLLH